MFRRLRNLWRLSDVNTSTTYGRLTLEQLVEASNKIDSLPTQRLATITSDYDPIKELKRQPE